eukprot:288892_1
MSVMLHNFKEFNIDFKHFESSDVDSMTHHMDHAKQSYNIVDCLSVVYGISNSVVSIFDSISDILFVTFLWFYVESQQNLNIKYAFLIVTVGNLISVGAIISLYMCYQSSVKSWMKKCLSFFIFLLLSQILPSLQWILKRFEIQNNDRLRVNPNHDGALLWFQQEIIRNKIFIMESIFESCWQIIIQFAALFEFNEIIETDIYLYVSITISLFVIMSK